MKTRPIGIIMNGVTGRMGTNQHLERSIVALRNQGGLRVSDEEVLMPEPVLVGRNPHKLAALAKRYGGLAWSTELDTCLADPNYPIYFDAQTTQARYDAARRAIAAGKAIYCEKPVAASLGETLELAALAEAKGVKNGVVQDKLWLPGLLKLKYLIDSGYFGRILDVHGEFGYWVFTGEHQSAQRPSWNYRAEDGGGIMLDMLCHFRYVVDNLFGAVKSLSCLGATHISRRWDEIGQPFEATADDAAYLTLVTEPGVICQINASWCVRVRRDDLFTLQVHGTQGSAVATLRDCLVQPDAATPRPVWNPDVPSTIDYYAGWSRMPDQRVYDNAFKAQWELFLRHVVLDEPFRWTLREGAKGVQLAELGVESWRKRCWLDVPAL